MKALIPPTLFTLARLGLFLAVVAWVVGRWWDVEFLLHGLDRKVIADQSGVSISKDWFGVGVPGGFERDLFYIWPEDDVEGNNVSPQVENSFGIDWNNPEAATITYGSDESVDIPELRHDGERAWCEIRPGGSVYFDPLNDLVDWIAPGIGVDHMGPFYPSVAVHIRHWLITSTFLAFNLLLHFIYRKRSEAVPCES